ncbi:hypothetical protein Hypma_001631 [Hypsizygus marmoreus]|uniref:Uncharacterized protein n=1 Tax=Hypsizygus marmoreus TaxID=39966 RepID=A0A369J8C6_HYPMA|nr:hypothetical protein Hypma_001631 [Hypsizygus marmoreus]
MGPPGTNVYRTSATSSTPPMQVLKCAQYLLTSWRRSKPFANGDLTREGKHCLLIALIIFGVPREKAEKYMNHSHFVWYSSVDRGTLWFLIVAQAGLKCLPSDWIPILAVRYSQCSFSHSQPLPKLTDNER